MAADTYAPLGVIRHHPNTWKSGPDYIDHQKYYAWLKHKAQASYRGEAYALSWPDWQAIWEGDLWHSRGRDNYDLALTRKDSSQAWSVPNCELITRMEQYRRQGLRRRGEVRGPYQSRQLKQDDQVS